MRNWAGNITFSTDDVHRPTSIEELRQVVGEATTLRALGSGHSFNAIADTTGTLVSTRELQLPIEVLTAQSVAIVPGGATFARVADALESQGWALHNLGSLPHISVAGACATGTHGSGVTNGCLASAVVGIELVLASGELLEVHQGHPDFPGMVLSLGALGVVTRLWLRIEPTYSVSQEVLLDIPFANAVDNADEILSSAYSVSMFTAFGRSDTIDSVWRKHRLDGSGRRSGPASADQDWGGRAATENVHPLMGLDPRAATQQLDQPGPWHHRLPHFRMEFTPSVGDELQSEFFVSREHAGAALAALGAASADFVQALEVFEMRTVAADDLWLSPFRGRETVALHVTWGSDLGVVRPALTALEDAIARFDPRPHWGKVYLGFDADRLAQLYPAAPQFRELAERLDPQCQFTNDYLTRVGMH